MEKVDKKKTSWFSSDLSLRIIAVIIAIIIWLFLSITEYPTINKTITNVPVVFSTDGTAAEEKGLQVLGYNDITVDVEIKGMNYEIGSYGPNDLSATVDVSNVTKAGSYPLDITVKSTHSSDTVNIVSVSPSTVDVNFVHIGTDEFPVASSSPNVQAAPGLTLRTPVVSPASVEVKGAEEDLKKIKRIEAVVEDSATLSEATTLSTEKVVFYDENNNALESSKYTLVSSKKFDITYDVYKKKTVNFEIDFNDCPPGFRPASIPYKLSYNSINVISPNLDDVDTQTIVLGTVSLHDIDMGKSFSFNVDQKLQSGEINQSGIDTVKLSFDFVSNSYIKRDFTIPASRIKVVNAPAEKVVNIETKQIPSVIMFGPASEVESISLSDINVVLDLSDISATGSTSHAVSIYADNCDSVWCIGRQEIQIDIEDKPAETTTSAATTTKATTTEKESDQ